MTPEDCYNHYYKIWISQLEALLLKMGFDVDSVRSHGYRKIYTPALLGGDIAKIEEFEIDGQLLARFSGNGVCYCMEFFSL